MTSSNRKRVGQEFLTARVKATKVRDDREIRDAAWGIVDQTTKLSTEQKIKMRRLAEDIVALHSNSDDDLIWSTLGRVIDLVASGYDICTDDPGVTNIHNIVAKGGPLEAFEAKLLTHSVVTVDTSKLAKAVYRQWDEENGYSAKKHKCPNPKVKCDSTDAPLEMVIAASGDENHTTEYKCRKCKHKWYVR